MNLIDKYTLVTEIERRRKIVEKRLYINNSYSEEGNAAWKRDKPLYDAYNYLLSFLDTLEVNEVDLKKEIDSYFERFQNVQCDEDCCNEGGFCYVLDNDLKIVDIERCRKIARHFFELGLKAQKGE